MANKLSAWLDRGKGLSTGSSGDNGWGSMLLLPIVVIVVLLVLLAMALAAGLV